MKKPKENWEEEFDLEWQTAFNNDFLIRDWDSIGRDLKRFISTLLQQERKRVLNLIQEELNDRIKYYEEETLPDMTEYIKGIRDFAQTIINFLKYEKNL